MTTIRKTQRNAWLLYGATGYSGIRIAELAIARGHRPVLAGRNASAVKELAQRLGLDSRVCDLDDSAGLRNLVKEFSAVLHCAGPFIHTWQAMAEACISSGTHYLDLSGEIPIYEGLAAMDPHARAANVMLMPGVGFDMVPGDCLALQLKRLLPDATHLEMGISFEGTLTRGSIRSGMLMGRETLVRRNHQLLSLKEKQFREIDFGPGRCGGRMKLRALTFGDISLGWRTTGIPNITSYQRPVPEFLAVLPNIKSPADVALLPAGPSDEELATIPSILVGEVRNVAGDARALRLVGPQAYAITFDAALTIAQRVHDGHLRKGFQTPAGVYGEDFIFELDGFSVEPWPPMAMPS